MIPLIDITPLAGPPGTARDACDRAIMDAAADLGFLQITGPANLIRATAETRADLLRFFTLPDTVKERLSRRAFVPGNANLYRGWFALQEGQPSRKEGIDIGPDVAGPVVASTDPLCELTPLPNEAELPGWRETAAAYYRSLTELGHMLMGAIARGLGLPEHQFDAAFDGGISTLRLLHYPARATVDVSGISGAPHIDSGFITLLAQDGVPGLQAQDRSGIWVSVPPLEGALVVNFGGLLERWTGGAIRATRHRVQSTSVERYSIPFFYEPRADAVIEALPGLPLLGSFLYGDHLWKEMTSFTEFRDLAGLRSAIASARLVDPNAG